jgi:hypothetical protein
MTGLALFTKIKQDLFRKEGVVKTCDYKNKIMAEWNNMLTEDFRAKMEEAASRLSENPTNA